MDRAQSDPRYCRSCGYRSKAEGDIVCGRCLERNKRRAAERKGNPAAIARHLALGKARNRRLTEEVLTAYGGRCACCGETELAFLTLDHVDNSGAAHLRLRRASGEAMNTYRWAKANDYPASLRVLCWNCNCARHFRGNGICPHELVVA